jgi:putative tricarboxylic transport membrane protein
MEILNNLLLGIATALTFNNILWCFIGVLLGTIVGVLPGLGPFAAISILLPLTYYADPISGIIMLAGIYYGTQYGGSTTSILLNLPGESSSVVTCTDGYQMTKNGRGGSALAVAAIGSFIAGCFATLIIVAVGVPLSIVAFKFGPAEYTALMIVGLIAAAALAKGSFLKAISMVVLGVLIGSIGVDINSGIERFTFNVPNLYDGISFAVVAMGMFGLAEIIYNILHTKEHKINQPSLKELYPSKQEIKDATPAILRGTGLGSLLGILPGAGAIISSFASYTLEKKISKNPEKFGKGAIEGVAGPESANNAAAQTSFIPMLSLGLPTTPVMALMIAALMIHDIQPGPGVISSNPSLFYGLVISMLLGNLFLVILNLPLVGLWIRIISIPRYILYPSIILFCIIGAYHINNNWFDVILLIPFTLIGYLFKKWDCEPAPLAMGFVVGTALEEYMRRALMISDGNWITFIDKPIALSLLTLAVILVIFSARSFLRKDTREETPG